MTLLIGQNSSTGYDQGHGPGAGAIFYEDFTCSVSGTATAIYLWQSGQTSSNKYKLAIWNTSGTLLAATAELSGNPAADDFYGGAISVALTSGTHYKLGFMCGTTFFFQSDTNTGVAQETSGTYPTVPNVNPGTDGTSGWGRLAIWVDGNVSAATPRGMLLLGAG